MKNMTNISMFLLSFLSVIFFTACTTSSISNTTQQPQVAPEVEVGKNDVISSSPTPTPAVEIIDENSWDNIINNNPRVTYDDVKSNKYNNQWVILNATVDKVEYKDYSNWVACDCWFSRGSTYRIEDIIFQCEELDGYDPTVIQEGNNIDICLLINRDASFGFDIKAFNITDESISISEIHDIFKENCMPLNSEDILRAPDKFRNTDYTVSGTIFQIISDDDYHVELLLSTAKQDEYIHVTYIYSENEPKLLENDFITVYGTYYQLFDYTSLLGTKHKVPSIVAQFVDNQSIN